MDVDADGSDSDRLPAAPGADEFQAATSYRWEKKTERPTVSRGTEQRLKRAEDEYAQASTAPARKRDLRNAIAELRTEIGTLKKFSFLIGATDPFIVVPGTFTRGPIRLKWAITRSWFSAMRFIQSSSETLVPTTKSARRRCASQKNSTRLQQPTIGRPRPSRARAGAVLLAGDQDLRRVLLLVAHRHVVDRHRLVER
jgi:hypothetical protein